MKVNLLVAAFLASFLAISCSSDSSQSDGQASFSGRTKITKAKPTQIQTADALAQDQEITEMQQDLEPSDSVTDPTVAETETNSASTTPEPYIDPDPAPVDVFESYAPPIIIEEDLAVTMDGDKSILVLSTPLKGVPAQTPIYPPLPPASPPPASPPPAPIPESKPTPIKHELVLRYVKANNRSGKYYRVECREDEAIIGFKYDNRDDDHIEGIYCANNEHIKWSRGQMRDVQVDNLKGDSYTVKCADNEVIVGVYYDDHDDDHIEGMMCARANGIELKNRRKVRIDNVKDRSTYSVACNKNEVVAWLDYDDEDDDHVTSMHCFEVKKI